MDPDPCFAGYAPARIGGGIAVLLVLVACGVTEPASAQPAASDDAAAIPAPAAPDPSQAPDPVSSDISDPATARRPSVVWRWEAATGTAGPAAPFESPRSAPGAAVPVDYRLWLGDRRTEVGIGLGSTSTVTLGLRHRISDRSRLTLDAPWSSSGEPVTGRARRMALELGFESSPLQGLAKGNLLRAQLSAHSSIALRLRGGRIGLYLGVRIAGAE